MTAYYNEIDPFAAAWLRELIKAGHIAHGVVDERSIEDVKPYELAGYPQCHFFAGIGVWSYALRQAGWPDDKPVWTGSCPCQPFSVAGKGSGFDDQRHLWPAFQHLISQCAPAIVFGEQVASKDADIWIDLVQADLEALGYAFGAIPFPSAGVGAPHIRDRMYWVADSYSERHYGVNPLLQRQECGWNEQNSVEAAWRGANGDVAPPINARPQRHGGLGEIAVQIGWERAQGHCTESSAISRMGDASRAASERNARIILGAEAQEHGERIAINGGMLIGLEHASASVGQPTSSPTNGFWRDTDWLACRDGKWRPVEPGTFPLAHGAAARVGRLRGYGNAINAEAGKAFIEAYLGV